MASRCDMSRNFIRKLGLEVLVWLPVWTQWQVSVPRSLEAAAESCQLGDSAKVPAAIHLNQEYGFSHM